MGRVAGVDGCPSGWLRVERGEDGRIESRVFASISLLLGSSAHLQVLAVDIPIGLSDNGPRLCDLEARRLLGPRASSVFPSPVRSTLEAESYADACARSEAACGKRLSQQAYAILPRIRAMDEALRSEVRYRDLVYEVHPEVCFYFWNDRVPMPHPKKSGQGFIDRLKLVSAHFGGVFDEIRSATSRRDASDDDILDAFAALWTAERIQRGAAVSVPAVPPVDGCALPMRMMS